MGATVTFDDVWKMFQETDRKFQETDRRFQETDRQLREMWAETDRKFQETDRKFQETDRKFQETDHDFQEMRQALREMSAKTDLKIQEVSKQIGRLGGRLGDFVEEMVAPACETLFIERNIPVHKVSRRVAARLPGNRRMEIDLLVVNEAVAMLVEVKSKLTRDDVRDHVARLTEFKGYFREYADKRIMGAVAGMVIEDHVQRFAMDAGLFVMVQSGDVIRLANESSFEPRIW